MHQHLILLLTKSQHIESSERKEEINNEVEEYCDLLDGMDVLIQGLQRERTGNTGMEEEGMEEERREMEEL